LLRREPGAAPGRRRSWAELIVQLVRLRAMGLLGKLVDNVSSKLAFFPPSPATYDVLTHLDGTNERYLQPTDP
jgi:hypothetical protein